MAQQTINTGSGVNKGDGDSLRTSFNKVNSNFNELYADVIALGDGIIATNITDSEGNVLVDSVGGTINAENLTGDMPAGVVSWVAISNIPTSIAGYGINDAYTKSQVDALLQASIDTRDFDLTGSVFADDSTLLVDAVNGIIPGYVSLATLQSEVAAATDFADFQARIAAL
jgi:hypothetical protein